jgi:prepilin-type N-terminal cleavage/methylation domain-containing protein
MKKLGRKSKSGFTLLEVLLAVVILCIASTMIMKGFVTVMIFGRNNRNYNKSGAANYEAAMHEIATNAMANNWMDNQRRNAGNGYTSLTLSYDAGHAAPVALPTIPVQVSSFSDGGPVFSAEDGNAYVIDGEEIDSSTTANNRFSFFYDFNDYMGSTGDHIYRWGFVFNPAAGHPYNAAGGFITPVYCDKNGNGLVGDDDPTARSSELLGYGRYGWYCFNINHGHMEGETYVPDSCRSTPRAGYPHD